MAERNRLALDLHDAVSQKLFGLVLDAEAARTLLDRDAEAAREQRREAAGARAGGARRAPLARLRAAPARARAGRARRRAAQARRGAAPARQHERRARPVGAASSPTAARPRAAPDRAGGAPERAQARAARGAIAVRLAGEKGRSCSRSRTTASASTRTRRGGPLAPARPDLDGGARAPDGAARSRSARRRRRHDRAAVRPRMAEPIRVLVVDDHAVVREGLRAFLAAPGRDRGRRARPPTARRRSRRRPGSTRTWS